jgi:hypothetical protein
LGRGLSREGAAARSEKGNGRVAVSNTIYQKVCDELRIGTSPHEAERIVGLIEEAICSLQQFKSKVLVETVTDADTQTAITPLDFRYIVIYVAIQFDGGNELNTALATVLEQIRER